MAGFGCVPKITLISARGRRPGFNPGEADSLGHSVTGPLSVKRAPLLVQGSCPDRAATEVS